MIQIKKTDSSNKDFISLVNKLDQDLFQRYPEIQSQYTQLNKVEDLKTVVVACVSDEPVGCGCFKVYDKESVEIKRMFVMESSRGKGISKLILNELEKWAIEMGFEKAILETGLNQQEAIGLYEKSGFKRIPNFGTYENMNNSVCFEKSFNKNK